MAACDNKKWSMDLVTDDAQPKKAHLVFDNVKVNLGLISGDVYYEEQRVSALTGTCTPIAEKASLMTFQFRLDQADIFLGGTGVERKDAKIYFYGGFRAFGTERSAALDPGDTGTGTGMQT